MSVSKLPKIILSLVLLLYPLYSQDIQPKEDVTDEAQKVTIPNPIELQPDWLLYFKAETKSLEERVHEAKTLLDSFYNQLETAEEKQEVEIQIKKFQSHLDSLLLLKKHEVSKPSLVWLPKTSYSVDEYLEISNQIRDINKDIRFKKTDQQRFRNSVSDVRQTLNNAFAKYLNLPEHSREKFLLGLEVMSLGARLLYLEAEIDLAKILIDYDNLQLQRYIAERDHIVEGLTSEIDLEKVTETKGKITQDLSNVHKELLGLEQQSIQTFSGGNAQEISRSINRKLTNALINEFLIKAKLFLLDAKFTLNKAIKNQEEINYELDIEPIKKFRNDTRKQLGTWEQIVSDEIDQISQALVLLNEDTSQEKTLSEYEASLKISLLSRAYLEALSNELYHIKVVLDLIDQHISERQNVFDQILFNIQNFSQWFTESFEGWLYYSLFDIGGVPITLMGLLKASLIILIAIWLSNLVGRTLKQFAKGKGKVLEPTLYTFRRIIHYIILLVGILFAFGSIGLTMRNMAIILGAIGIGVGFGLQNIVNNFLCGLAILFERNVKIGDYVELESGYLGKITEVNVQNTTLHTFDGLDVLVPNSAFIGNNVINWTKKDPYQRLHIPFGVAYGTDQKKVSEVVIEVALKLPYTMREIQGVREPEVWLVEFGDSSLNFELVIWVNILKSRGRKAMKAEYLSEIEIALKKHDIHIPFPQRDLHLKTLPNSGIQISKN